MKAAIDINHEQANAGHRRIKRDRDILADADAAAVKDRATLATLPVTRKSDLTELQASHPPFGGCKGSIKRISGITPGPG